MLKQNTHSEDTNLYKHTWEMCVCVCDVCQGVCSWENLQNTAKNKEWREEQGGKVRIGRRRWLVCRSQVSGYVSGLLGSDTTPSDPLGVRCGAAETFRSFTGH